jgi:hypothetical protein
MAGVSLGETKMKVVYKNTEETIRIVEHFNEWTGKLYWDLEKLSPSSIQQPPYLLRWLLKPKVIPKKWCGYSNGFAVPRTYDCKIVESWVEHYHLFVTLPPCNQE